MAEIYFPRLGLSSFRLFLESNTSERDLFRIMANNARALLRIGASLSLIAAVPCLLAQKTSLQVPAGIPVQVQLDRHAPLKKGEPLTCHLLHPVYADNQLVLPPGTVAGGVIVALVPDHSRRLHARLWGDFTPFYIPVVRFDQFVLPDGTTKQIVAPDATDGAPVLHLSPPVSSKARSFLSQQFQQLKQRAKDTADIVTAPGRKDRLVQFLYKQLPYHPQRIDADTAWTITLGQPLVVKPYSNAAAAAPAKEIAASHENSAWRIHAYLTQTISSASEKPGNTFQAIVAEPIFNADHTLAVPEGSILVGDVTQARPARSFGRSGKLRFDFREIRFPGKPPKNVMGTLTGAEAAKAQQLQIDQEGGVQSQPQNRVIVPLILSLLASRALDDDGNAAGNAAIGSNGFGIIGRIIGIVGGSRSLAAGIGFYGAGLSFSERWLVHGQNVVFTKNTRIDITTIPGRNPLPTPPAEQLPGGKN